MNHSSRLGTSPVRQLLLNLSIPAIIAMFMNALYNVVDSIFVGQSVGKLGIGALAVTFPIQIINFSFAIAMAVGASSGISRNLGAKNHERADAYFSSSYIVVIIISIIVTIVGVIFTDDLLRFFGATEEILPYARDYARIIFIGFIPHGLAVLSNNIIRAEGSALYSMIAMTTGVVVNIFLDPLLIFAFNMGVRGAAIATITSQFLSFIICMFYFYSGRSAISVLPHQIKFKLSIAWDTFVVGMPTFVRNAIGSIAVIILNNSMAYYAGNTGISTYGIIDKLLSFAMMPSFGFVQGLQPIAGYNYGANFYHRVKEAISLTIKWITIVLLIVATCIFIFPGFFIRLFTQDPDLLEMGPTAIRIVFSMIPLVGMQIVTSSLYQSFGMARPAFFLSLLRQAFLLIPLVFILPNFLGVWGIFLAFPISDLLTFIISAILFKRVYSLLKGEVYNE